MHFLAMNMPKRRRLIPRRTAEIEAVRAKLPAILREQEIVEAVRSADVSLICGDTGCGKSTQVPQFLLEAGFCDSGKIICVTQPRRVAAISVSKRVAEELNDSEIVGYQVRYDTSFDSATVKIKFETDGILLREIQQDFLLTKYSVIIVDEAHERSVNCDILLGLLSRSVKIRREAGDPLKLVIMSATLRLTDFTENKRLFPNSAPPVVQIDARTHPVILHYEKTTEADYLEIAKEKVLEIHQRLPPGSILVFVTGKHEVHELCDALTSENPRPRRYACEESGSDTDSETAPQTALVKAVGEPVDWDKINDDDETFNLGVKGYSENLIIKNGKAEKTSEKPTRGALGFKGCGPGGRIIAVPLYAQLSPVAQELAFHVHENARVVVVATNVAETALTLPNIRYVVDCGREKRREIASSGSAGISRFRVTLESQASADQRAGRAGRVGPGHAYRLFSPAVFGEHMQPFPPVEILNTPLDQPLLFMASLGISGIFNFPWPTPPPMTAVRAAALRLHALGALEEQSLVATPLGLKMSSLPLSPRFALILLRALQRSKEGILAAACACVAALSVGDLLEEKWEDGEPGWLKCETDVDALLWAVSAYMWSPSEAFCMQHKIRSRAVAEAAALTTQLHKLLLKKIGITVGLPSPLTPAQAAALRECVVEGFIDRIAVRDDDDPRSYRTAERVAAKIHPTSRSSSSRPSIVAFGEIIVNSTGKAAMRYVIPVDPVHLGRMKTPLIERGEVLKFPPRQTLKNGKTIGFIRPVYKPLDYILPTVDVPLD